MLLSNEHECMKTTRFCIENFDLQSKINRIVSMKTSIIELQDIGMHRLRL